MRKIVRLSLILLSVFALSSCNEGQPSGSTGHSSHSGSTTSESTSSTGHTSHSGSTTTSGSTSTGSSTPVSSDWTGDAFNCLISFVGEQIPYLDGFNSSFTIGNIDGSSIPYFNPYIKDAKDYTTQYASELSKLGFVFDGTDTESGYTKYVYYHKDIVVTTAYYSNDGSKWFDVYAYNDKGSEGIEPGAKAEIIPSDFDSKSYKNISKDINGHHMEAKNIMNQASTIQFKKSEGSIVVTGSAMNKLAIQFAKYSFALFVKAGTSKSNAKLITNKGSRFDLNGATYLELITPTIGTTTARTMSAYLIAIY